MKKIVNFVLRPFRNNKTHTRTKRKNKRNISSARTQRRTHLTLNDRKALKALRERRQSNNSDKIRYVTLAP